MRVRSPILARPYFFTDSRPEFKIEIKFSKNGLQSLKGVFNQYLPVQSASTTVSRVMDPEASNLAVAALKKIENMPPDDPPISLSEA